MSQNLHIVILAAGEGTRMRSNLPKVLHLLGGRPMLMHLLETATTLNPARIHVVIGSGADLVREACAGIDVNWVVQSERKGTGHAVIQAMPAIPDDASVLVLLGDHPLIPSRVLADLSDHHTSPLSVLTMEPEEPRGYGRIVRDRTGRITKVVEDKDATPAQLAIPEVNTGIILAGAGHLRRWLERLDCDNSKQEYYLTDIFAMAHKEGARIEGVLAPDSLDLQGANDRKQLSQLEARLRHQRANALMKKGVQIMDTQRIDIRGNVQAGRDVCLDINVILEGDVVLGDGVLIGPGCLIRDCELAPGTRVHAHSVLEGAMTTGACDIGPFARVRPGTELAAGSRIGNFVEIKNSSLGVNSKASHLSYLGDSQIGEEVNIGAGTITCNYDGVNKHRTVIEDGAFIGSNSQLVAPVRIGRNATIGAGSTITHDAPAETLTTSRVKQHSTPGWKRPVKKDR
jgi:bifunctional UDP-N-acetylglucosamine pyrophosphorylase/glucosamine-1-phosphate N-acetyltransferase